MLITKKVIVKVIAYVCKHARVFQGFWETLGKRNKKREMLQQLCCLESWNYSRCQAPEAAAVECSLNF